MTANGSESVPAETPTVETPAQHGERPEVPETEEPPETEESPEAQPYRECRHLLTIRGGTLGCTAPAGHPTLVHYDEDFPLPDGQVAAWECKDTSRDDGVPSACRTFLGYVDTAAGQTAHA